MIPISGEAWDLIMDSLRISNRRLKRKTTDCTNLTDVLRSHRLHRNHRYWPRFYTVLN